MARTSNHANKGVPLEEYITNIVNARYLREGRAQLHKIPTGWLPIRDGRGAVVSAKVEEGNTAAVDYMGKFEAADGTIRPIAFDAKSTEEPRVRWDRVTDDQAAFLDNWIADGYSIGFVLVGFQLKDFYLIPWHTWSKMRADSKIKRPGSGMAQSGTASFAVSQAKHWQALFTGGFADYLAVVDNWLHRD